MYLIIWLSQPKLICWTYSPASGFKYIDEQAVPLVVTAPIVLKLTVAIGVMLKATAYLVIVERIPVKKKVEFVQIWSYVIL